MVDVGGPVGHRSAVRTATEDAGADGTAVRRGAFRRPASGGSARKMCGSGFLGRRDLCDTERGPGPRFVVRFVPGANGPEHVRAVSSHESGRRIGHGGRSGKSTGTPSQHRRNLPEGRQNAAGTRAEVRWTARGSSWDRRRIVNGSPADCVVRRRKWRFRGSRPKIRKATVLRAENLTCR